MACSLVGFFWSTILLSHATFTVNSLAHRIGRRRFDTPDTSRNSWLVALLTGGANGIGAATVRALHQQGARVFFCDVDVKAGKALEKELAPMVSFSKVDLLKEKEVLRWIENIGKRWEQEAKELRITL